MSAGVKMQLSYWTGLALGIAAGLLAMSLSAGEACRIRVAQSTVDSPVGVLGVYGHGTGVPVAEHVVATAWHVVSNGGQIGVEYAGKWRGGVLLAADEAADVALVTVDEVKMKSVKLAPNHEVTVDTFDKQCVVAAECGILSGTGKQGNSGAPVMCDGRLIGIVIAVDVRFGAVRGGYMYAGVAVVRRLLRACK